MLCVCYGVYVVVCNPGFMRFKTSCVFHVILMCVMCFNVLKCAFIGLMLFKFVFKTCVLKCFYFLFKDLCLNMCC